MNYADIKCNDAANGPGVRISLFVSGCTHHCKGCFNEVTWDFNYGNPFTQKEIDMIIKDLEPPYISGLTILGGEPMEPANQPGILPLIRKVREVYGSGKQYGYTAVIFLTGIYLAAWLMKFRKQRRFFPALMFLWMVLTLKN